MCEINSGTYYTGEMEGGGCSSPAAPAEGNSIPAGGRVGSSGAFCMAAEGWVEAMTIECRCRR